MDPIFLLAPTSVDARIAAVARAARGFVYYVSLKGVTGAANLDLDSVQTRLLQLRQKIHLPIGVGFGIRDGATAKAIAQFADAVVIGSRIVEEIEKARKFERLILIRAQVLDSCALLKENGRCDAEGLNALVRKGEKYMDEIRALKSSMEADLDRSFTGKEKAAGKTFRNDRIALLFSAFSFLFIIGLVLIVLNNDFKQRNRLEKELRALNINKNKFFTIISHDLRGPVHGIAKLAAFLKHKDTTQEEVASMGEVIEETSNRVSGLLENLLTWSRIQMNRLEYRPEHFDVFPLAKACINDLEALSRLKNIEIVNEIQSMRIFADRNMIETVFRNLISNGIKFSHPKGKVLLSSRTEGRNLVITVADKGIGIPKAILDELFTMEGTQTSRGTADETGTGLGLLLCREFLEKNEGSIQVESTESGGTRFHISLPLERTH